MRKLLLVQPAKIAQVSSCGDTRAWGLPPLGLAYVASLTPPDWKVRIVDEYVEKVPFDEQFDLVGIGGYTPNAPRAYQISEEFRRRGIPTVMGGVHVSMVPDEAVLHTDAVVVGEAEAVWSTVIDDFEKGRLQKKYSGDKIKLVDLPIPRRDLLSDKYSMDVIQTARGCPFNCEFCSVTAFNGSQYRQRPVDEILAEMALIKKKLMYIIDDNFIGYGKESEERAIELFRGMIDRKFNKIWGTQVSVNFADNEKVLEYAYKSGCRVVYVGFESIVHENLRGMRKGVNANKGAAGFKKAVDRMHAHGIGVLGSFIVGNDNDDVHTFRRLYDFMGAANMDMFILSCLTPLPGTKLFERLKAEDRIIYTDFPADWEKYDTDHVVMKPKNMLACELACGYQYLASKWFTRRKLAFRFLKTLAVTKDPVTALFSYSLNKSTWKYLIYDRDPDRVVSN